MIFDEIPLTQIELPIESLNLQNPRNILTSSTKDESGIFVVQKQKLIDLSGRPYFLLLMARGMESSPRGRWRAIAKTSSKARALEIANEVQCAFSGASSEWESIMAALANGSNVGSVIDGKELENGYPCHLGELIRLVKTLI